MMAAAIKPSCRPRITRAAGRLAPSPPTPLPRVERGDEKPRTCRRGGPPLGREYPDAKCSLDFKSPLELLVATILSAQCTDERVNMVTPGVVSQVPHGGRLSPRPRWPSWKRRSRAPASSATRPRTSRPAAARWSSNTRARCRRISSSWSSLPGVGRKTANVVLGTAFGIASGVVVDTHVTRLSRRLGLTAAEGPGEDRAGPDGAVARSRSGSPSATA